MSTFYLLVSNLFALLWFAAFFTVAFIALVVFTKAFVSKAKSYLSIDFGSTLKLSQMILKTIMSRLAPTL